MTLTPDPQVHTGLRIDEYLALAMPGLSRRQAGLLCSRGFVTLLPNDKSPGVSRQVKKGDHVSPGFIFFVDCNAAGIDEGGRPVPPPPAESPQARLLCYQDDHLIGLNKPPGLPCHANRPDQQHTLVNQLVALVHDHPVKGWPQPLQAGLLNRIDTGTSGLVVAARRPEEFPQLVEWIRAQGTKTYLMIFSGCPTWETIVCDAPIETSGGRRVTAHHPSKPSGYDSPGNEPINRGNDQSMHEASIINGAWRAARTDFTILARNVPEDLCLVQGKISQGQMHQIRAHAALLGYPLLGDTLYHGRSGPPHQVLHSWRLTLPPTLLYPDGLHLEADLPEHFLAIIRQFFPNRERFL